MPKTNRELRRRRLRRARSERGAALVEMAIVIPLLLLLVFGAIEFGVFVKRNIDLTQGVREAGRQGAVAAFDGGVTACKNLAPTDSLVCLAKNRIGLSNVAVWVIAPPANNYKVGSPFAVCAIYQTQSITGLLKPFLPKTIHAESIMRLEQAPTTGLLTGGDADPTGNNWSSCTPPA